MRKLALIAVLGSLTISTVAQANVGIDVNIVDQQRQIDAGKRSGKLSLRERRVLTSDIRAIKRTVERYENSGGRFTRGEKATVNALLRRNQDKINRLKDNRVRGPNDVPF
jgi:hypothetical protein